jgi:hypothetical protein
MTPFHEVLAPLLTGFTVTKVEAGQGREGDPARITCRKGDTVRTFEVWGGIYGPCVSHVKESRAGAPEAWTDVEGMFTDITDHAPDGRARRSPRARGGSAVHDHAEPAAWWHLLRALTPATGRNVLRWTCSRS